MKTADLELRPISVILENHVRAHVLVVMLAYMMIKELSTLWKKIKKTVQEGINDLSSLVATEVKINGQVRWVEIPEARKDVQELINAAKIEMPSSIKSKGITIQPRKTLKRKE